jgi:hypothetical protein
VGGVRGRSTVVAVAGVLAWALAGCGASPAAAPDLRVALEQSRDNENRHLLQVVLTNDGAAPVEVVRLQLRAPGWTGVPPTARTDVLRPGRRLAFPVDYGTAVCGRDGPATVVVGSRTDRGLQETELVVPADDPLLPRLHARECDLRALAEAVEVAFDDDAWQRDGEVVHGRLVARRLGRASVAVDALEGTVVFTLRPGARLPLELASGPAEVPVSVTASRCDFHALIESKRSYDFPWVATLDGGAPLSVTVRPGPRGVALLERLLADVCAPR